MWKEFKFKYGVLLCTHFSHIFLENYLRKHWQAKRYIQHCRTLFTQTGSLIEFPTTKRERDSYYYFWLESVNGSWVNIYFISIRIQYSATFMSNSMIVVVEFYSVEGEIQLTHIFWSLWIPSDVCLIVCVKSWVRSFKNWVLTYFLPDIFQDEQHWKVY